MFRYILIVLLLLLPQPAQADCYMPQHPGAKEGTVAATWPAKHVADGDIGGCLLKFSLAAGGEWLGYTRYDFICRLGTSEKITLMPDFACCDTGDHGDFACGVKPRAADDTFKRTNITLAPATPDARAIPDMVQALLSGGKLRDASAAIRLKEYLGVQELAAEVRKQVAPLEAALDNNAIADSYTRAEVAALLVAAHPESPKKRDWQIDFFSNENGYALTDAQISVVAELTSDASTADRFIPLLAEKLRRTDEPSREFILLALQPYGAAAKPYANALRDAFTSELPTDWDKPAEAPADPPKNTVEAARRAQMMQEVEKQSAEKTARAKKLLPYLAKIACHGETGKVTIGKNYPTTIDCAQKP